MRDGCEGEYLFTPTPGPVQVLPPAPPLGVPVPAPDPLGGSCVADRDADRPSVVATNLLIY